MRRNTGLPCSQGQDRRGSRAQLPWAKASDGGTPGHSPLIPSGVRVAARREGRMTQSEDDLGGRPDRVVGRGPPVYPAPTGKSGGTAEIRGSGHSSVDAGAAQTPRSEG